MTQTMGLGSSSVLTVATVDYVPQALATLNSARRHCPRSSFYLFAVDATADAVAGLRRLIGDHASWLHIFGPNELGSERTKFLKACERYNVLELCCFAKYIGMSHVMRDPSAGDVCIFADSDTLFLGDVHAAVAAAMAEQAVLVTPHLLAPASDDVEHDIMSHGWMNAGFLAFRREHPGSRRVLDWLIDRISRRGYLAPQYAMSCDQQWVSALPVLFREFTCVSTHRGLNIGYWNLRERSLTKSGTEILAGGSPLLLFHFSGFDWPRSKRLSKHADVVVLPGSPLEELCQLYQSELQDTALLQARVQELGRMACAKANVIERIRAASRRDGVHIATLAGHGLFSRLGGKVDALLRKTMVWRER